VFGTCQFPTGLPTTEPTSTPTGDPSGLPSGEPSGHPSSVPSGEPSSEPSRIPSVIPSGQPSASPTSAPSGEPTSLPSGIPTGHPTGQPSGEPSVVPTGEPSGEPSGQPSGEPSGQPSGEPTASPTSAPSGEPTSLPSGEPTGQPTGQPSGEPSVVPTGQPTGEPSGQPTGEPTASPTSAPSGEPTSLPSGIPTGHPTGQPSGEPSVVPTGEPSGKPSGQPTGEPTASPTSAPSGEPTSLPSGEPTGYPTGQPSGEPSGCPTGSPTYSPSSVPSGQPSETPSSLPSGEPTGTPTSEPSSVPSATPTCAPSGQPSGEPTSEPSRVPSGIPSTTPSSVPSNEPTLIPSGEPSSLPTTSEPSSKPSAVPTASPSGNPSCKPSGEPSGKPSSIPSGAPTGNPSEEPSGEPSRVPTSVPSSVPTVLTRFYLLKAIGGGRAEYASSILVSIDWGSFIAGYDVGNSAGEYDGFVLRLDACGNAVWSMAYGGPAVDSIRALMMFADGSIGFVGEWTDKRSPLTTDMLVGRIDAATGQLIHAFSLVPSNGVSTDTGLTGLVIAEDNSVLVAGTSVTSQGTIGVVTRVTVTGNIMWSKAIGQAATGVTYQFSGHCLARLNSGDFVVVGHSTNAKSEVSQGFITRLDATYGDHMSSFTVSMSSTSNQSLAVGSVVACRDGGYVLLATLTDATTGITTTAKLLLMKFDANNALQWAIRIESISGGISFGRVIRTGNDDSFVMVGTLTSGVTIRGIVVKVKSTGSINWAKVYGRGGYWKDYVTDVVELPGEGGYRIVGNGYSYRSGASSDIFMAQIGVNGNLNDHPAVTDITARLKAVSWTSGVVVSNVPLSTGAMSDLDLESKIVTSLLSVYIPSRSEKVYTSTSCNTRNSLFSHWPTHFPTTQPTSSVPTSFPTSSSPTSSIPSGTPSTTSPSTSNPTSSVPTGFPSTSTPSSSSPTAIPSVPTGHPSGLPSILPGNPTPVPTLRPTHRPTLLPTFKPSMCPTSKPSVKPSVSPTSRPTVVPTTRHPTMVPTMAPTSTPTTKPSSFPTPRPSRSPTLPPTLFPTQEPSTSTRPTIEPSLLLDVTPSVNPTDSPTELNQVDARSAGGVGEDNPLVGVFLIFIIMSLFLLCCLGFRSFLRWYNEDKEYTMIDFVIALCGAFGDDDEAAARAKELRKSRRKGVIEAQVEDPETGEMKTLYFYPVHGSSTSASSSTNAVPATATGVGGFHMGGGNRGLTTGLSSNDEREAASVPSLPAIGQSQSTERGSSADIVSSSNIPRAVRSSGVTALIGHGPSQKHPSRERNETSNMQIINLDSSSSSSSSADSGDSSDSVDSYPPDCNGGRMASHSRSSVAGAGTFGSGSGSQKGNVVDSQHEASARVSTEGKIGGRIRAISFERSGVYGVDDEHTIDDYVRKYLGGGIGDDDSSSSSSSSGNDGVIMKTVHEPVEEVEKTGKGAFARSGERKLLRLDDSEEEEDDDDDDDDSDLGILDRKGLPTVFSATDRQAQLVSDSDADSPGDSKVVRDEYSSSDSDIVVMRRHAKPPASSCVGNVNDQNDEATTKIEGRNHDNSATARRKIIVLISSSDDDDDRDDDDET
jgi:hypothetical protein